MSTVNPVAGLDVERAVELSERVWEDEIIPLLTDYIKIPNKSPHFDADWAEHGYMDQAVELIAAWCRKQPLEGLKVEVVRLEGRTPVIFMEIPGAIDDTVLLYGHFDKQPEMEGWREDLGPWEPKREGDKLYGRGGADDGYSAFASLLALRMLAEQGRPHARCVVLIEGCEESGSFDLPFYMEELSERIGTPSLVVCLDSGCGNYEQLWSTTSLRGGVFGELRVEVLREGVHSGDAGGIVPDSFRVLRSLLDRIEGPLTGEILVPEFHAAIPPERIDQAGIAARELGDQVHAKFPFLDGVSAEPLTGTELVLNRTWRPSLAVTGADGMPSVANAGNVCRPYTAMKLSLRTPPTCDSERAIQALKQRLEVDPPYGAKVTFEGEAADGWNAPPVAPWLAAATDEASQAFFGKPAVHMGEGGTIPFMGMLGERFPDAQFLITGVLGPESNAHGPNEFLHIPTGKRVTCCVAQVLSAHAAR